MLQGYEPIITEYSSGTRSRSLGPFCASKFKKTNNKKKASHQTRGVQFEQAQITFIKTRAALR